MSRKKVEHKKMESFVSAEFDVLVRCAEHVHPACMRLLYAFTFDETYHLVIPMASAGDLAYHLKELGLFDEKRTRVYAAEIASGLNHMHSVGVLNRDLKPANVLINSKGHCVLSDFGLSTLINPGGSVKGKVGTPG